MNFMSRTVNHIAGTLVSSQTVKVVTGTTYIIVHVYTVYTYVVPAGAGGGEEGSGGQGESDGGHEQRTGPAQRG